MTRRPPVCARRIARGIGAQGALLTACLAIGAPAPAAADPTEQASAHFRNAERAHARGDLAEAARELAEAYRLQPEWRVLYNIALVQAKLGHAADALTAYEAYLDQGGAAIDRKRRRLVEAEIDILRTRVGTLVLRVAPAGTEVVVNGRPAGAAPIDGPMRVTAGTVTVEARHQGHTTQTRALSVAAGSIEALDLTLEPLSPPPPPAPRGPPPIVERGQDRARVARFALVAGGAIAAGVGGVLALQGQGRAEAARTRVALGDDWDAAKNDFDSARTRNYVGWSIGALGVGVAAAGALWLLTTDGTASAQHESVGVGVTAAGLGGLLDLRGRF